MFIEQIAAFHRRRTSMIASVSPQRLLYGKTSGYETHRADSGHRGRGRFGPLARRGHVSADLSPKQAIATVALPSMASMFVRVGSIAAVVLLGGSVGVPSPAASDLEGHQSSLHARVTMTDGTRHTITLQGVGCAQGMCSRVRVRDTKTDSVWLDGLASVRDISQNAEGPVHAVFTLKDGSSRETSITALNRVLYVGSHLWTHQLDLTGVSQIDFE